MDEGFFNRLFESKIVFLLIIGILMLVVSRLVKRSRSAEDLPGAAEKVFWVGGMLVTLASLIYAGSRGCMVDVPDKEEEPIPSYSKEAPGCSKPDQEKIKDYKKE
jgi:hypothetical protein